MQNFLLASAALLNAIGIPVKHLEDRQRLQFCGKFLGHVQRRRQGHHGVEADVVLAAKSARVGQRRGGGQSSQIRARTQLLHQRWQQPVDGRLLHQAHQRLQRAESQFVSGLLSQGGRQSQFAGHLIAHGGDQHASTDFSQKFPTSTRRIHNSSPFRGLLTHDLLIRRLRATSSDSAHG